VVPGKAKVIVELESSTGKKAAPCELEVTIEQGVEKE
jgi:hypothetical protein